MSSRRQFLKRTLQGSAAAVAATTLPSTGCIRFIDPAPVADVDPPVNGKLTVELSRWPELAPLGSAITVRAPGIEPVLLAHWSDGQYVAVDSVCTHAGCPLGFFENAIECPCHGARFGAEGEVLRPPAVQGLRKYPVTVELDRLVIDLWAGSEGFPAVNEGRIFFAFSQFPELRTAGNSVAGTPEGLGRPLVVVATDDGGYAALDATCSHLACTVAFDPAATQLRCPCHGSTFNLTGEATRPPATLPLRRFTATHDADGVTVQIA